MEQNTFDTGVLELRETSLSRISLWSLIEYEQLHGEVFRFEHLKSNCVPEAEKRCQYMCALFRWEGVSEMNFNVFMDVDMGIYS